MHVSKLGNITNKTNNADICRVSFDLQKVKNNVIRILKNYDVQLDHVQNLISAIDQVKTDIAKIADTHSKRITSIDDKLNTEINTFKQKTDQLGDTINTEINKKIDDLIKQWERKYREQWNWINRADKNMIDRLNSQTYDIKKESDQYKTHINNKIEELTNQIEEIERKYQRVG